MHDPQVRARDFVAHLDRRFGNKDAVSAEVLATIAVIAYATDEEFAFLSAGLMTDDNMMTIIQRTSTDLGLDN